MDPAPIKARPDARTPPRSLMPTRSQQSQRPHEPHRCLPALTSGAVVPPGQQVATGDSERDHNYVSPMSSDCCHSSHAADPHRGDPAYRRILLVVLAINAAMFLVEIGAGLAAGSASLQADALDFLGDAANYSISLFVIGLTLRYRAAAAFVKGASMGLFGLWVIGTVMWHALHGTLPNAFTMGAVGVAALIANAASFGLLWAYRSGDANMHSAWICTRNDVLGNLAVLVAAAGVFGTGTGWPDIIVAIIMAGLALQGAALVISRSLLELRQPVPVSAHR
jgi:Co/Zn/Cd efflux system component